LNAANSLQDPNSVRSVTRQLAGAVESLDLPAHSINILELTAS
jgi:hypothetical protein